MNASVRSAALLIGVVSLGLIFCIETTRAADPVFQANFDKTCADQSDDWKVSNQLRRQGGVWSDRFACKSDATRRRRQSLRQHRSTPR